MRHTLSEFPQGSGSFEKKIDVTRMSMEVNNDR